MKILVLAATGIQGYPSVCELVKDGHEVSGFTLAGDPKAPALEEMGVQMYYGDLMNPDDLYQAMCGKDAVVFIPALPTSGNPIPEFTVGYNVVTSAERAGIEYLIHTSVNRAGQHETFTKWGRNFWESYRMYWIGKSVVIDLVKMSKIRHWTILKPAYMMNCFVTPKVFGMYPQLRNGKIVSARDASTKVTMFCGEDMGRVVAEVFRNFDRFEGREIDLAGDSLNMEEVAKVLSEVTGKSIVADSKPSAELSADPEFNQSLHDVYTDFPGMDISAVVGGTIDAFEWDNEDGYKVDIEKANSYGVKLMTFKEWAELKKDEFVID